MAPTAKSSLEPGVGPVSSGELEALARAEADDRGGDVAYLALAGELLVGGHHDVDAIGGASLQCLGGRREYAQALLADIHRATDERAVVDPQADGPRYLGARIAATILDVSVSHGHLLDRIT
jgi:hypothetical protein